MFFVGYLRYKSEYRNYNLKDFINSIKIFFYFKLEVVKYIIYIIVGSVFYIKKKFSIEFWFWLIKLI